jgi:hypothetical protein
LQADPNLSQLPFLNINSPLDFDLWEFMNLI